VNSRTTRSAIVIFLAAVSLPTAQGVSTGALYVKNAFLLIAFYHVLMNKDVYKNRILYFDPSPLFARKLPFWDPFAGTTMGNQRTSTVNYP